MDRKYTSLILLFLALTTTSTAQNIVKTFTNPAPDSFFNHLAVDINNGTIYVGAVNRIYQLSSDLELFQTSITGPVNETTAATHSFDNVNKALLIDYANNRLITCGSAYHGTCVTRKLDDLSNVNTNNVQVVANDATTSTVAFISPVIPLPDAKQKLYVGVGYTGNSVNRADVPAVSRRTLNDNLFTLANNGNSPSRIYVNSLSRDRYPITYVFGFSSEGFSYFLTYQPKSVGSKTFYSKLVRICNDDPSFYSYTEIPITCAANNGTVDYNLVQAAYVGKAGTRLAREFKIADNDDVLYAVFSQSESTNIPSDRSALCVYTLKDIRRKFTENIKNCFSGKGSRGLDFITPTQPCVAAKSLQINDDFCGIDANTPLGGELAVEGTPLTVFTKRLTAVATLASYGETTVFAGTAYGGLKKIIVESSTSAFETSDTVIDANSPVNKDLFFDLGLNHLYVVTERKITKVEVDHIF